MEILGPPGDYRSKGTHNYGRMIFLRAAVTGVQINVNFFFIIASAAENGNFFSMQSAWFHDDFWWFLLLDRDHGPALLRWLTLESVAVLGDHIQRQCGSAISL